MELKNRDRGQRWQEADASALQSAEGSEEPAAESAGRGGGETEKHKIKEQLRRAKKRQLLTQLQALVIA
jgi:hypothetical protein